MSRLQYSTCRIERIFLVHILHALFGSSSSHAPVRSRAVRNRVETAVAVALTSLVDETLSTLRKVRGSGTVTAGVVLCGGGYIGPGTKVLPSCPWCS